MTKKRKPPSENTRTFRKSTAEQRERRAKVIEQIEVELPEIKQQAAGVFAASRAARQAIGLLRDSRLEQQLSFGDMARLTGMSRETCHKIENDQQPNPTIRTLVRYANGLGLSLDISFKKLSKKKATTTPRTDPIVVQGMSNKSSQDAEERSEAS